MTILGVLGLNGRLLGLPPVAVVSVPVNGVLEPGFEVGELRLPTKFGPQLGGVDRVAEVVTRPVLDLVVGIGRLPHHFEDQLKDVLVVLLAVGADQVGLTDLALGQDRPDGARVVVGVNPVTDVFAGPVELWPDPREDVRDLARDELLDVLVGAVVVRAVRDRGAKAKGADPGADQ